MIKGPIGNLEAVLDGPEVFLGLFDDDNSSCATDTELQIRTVGLVCHPHPQHGGTLHNKVVTTAARALRECEIPSIRFNYRGVGKSDGEYANTVGEADDALAILQALKTMLPDVEFIVIGFSFGSAVAYRVRQLIPLSHLVLLAPPVHHFDFTALLEPKGTWTVIQPMADEIVPAEEVVAWVEQTTHSPHFIPFAETSHFFHGQLIELRNALKALFG